MSSAPTRAPSAATAKPTAWTAATHEQFGSDDASTLLHYAPGSADMTWVVYFAPTGIAVAAMAYAMYLLS